MSGVAAVVPGDRAYMARALELAALGLYTTDPNPRVGCILVRDGRVIGEGWHERAGGPHAEVLALREANATAAGAQGATAYVTLEPCSHTGRTPPCADALVAAGVRRVVCAAVDPNPRVSGAGIRRLTEAGIEVSSGLEEDATRALNPGFFSRFERGRPFVRLKLAMSLDARTAAGGGGWITGEAARRDVQTWRARSSAVLTGAGTVRCDDPRLDVRLAYGDWVRQPLRVVLDPGLACKPDAKVFKDADCLVFGSPEAAVQPRLESRTRRVPRAPRGLDLGAVLAALTALETNELLAECGPRLAAALLEADLVDELLLYVAPRLLGADAPPLAALSGSDAGARAPHFEFVEQRLIGEDLRLRLNPRRPSPCSPA